MLATVFVYGQTSTDEAAIKAVIETETRAWHAGDIKAFDACWQIQPYSRALISLADGTHMALSPSDMRSPDRQLTGDGSTTFVNSNYLMHVSGTSAWANFDQVTTAKDGTQTYSHEIRILEKSAGSWYLTGMSAHLYKP